jgi:hypothetical protein
MSDLLARKKGPMNLVLLLGLPCIMALGAWKIKSGLSPFQLKEFLGQSEPPLLWLNLFLLALGLWLSREALIRAAGNPGRPVLIKLGLIILLALVLRTLVAPHTHHLYYDEDIYMNIAHNMVADGKAVATDYGTYRWDDYFCRESFMNKQPNAHPALVSVIFMILGVNERWAFFLNIILSSLTPLLLFFLARLLYDDRIALWAAFFFTLIPVAIVWSASTSTEPPMVFFITLTFLLLACFSRDHDFRVLFAAAMSLTYAVQFRPEGVILLPLAFLFLLIFDRQAFEHLQELRFTLIWMLVCFLMAQHALHLTAFIHDDWGALGRDKFSTAYLAKNVKDNLSFFIQNREFPVVFTLFAITGLTAFRAKWREKLFVLIWCGFASLPFLFFYAGSFKYGVDVRFSLFVLPPVCILCSLGMDFTRRVLSHFLSTPHVGAHLALFVAIVFLPHLPFIRTVHEEAWSARFDHDFIVREAKKLPFDAVVFCHCPYIVVTAGRGALHTHYGSDNYRVDEVFGLTNNVYFYRDYWCYAPLNKCDFDYFSEHFEMTPVATERLYDREYTLYRIKKK